MFLMEKIIKQRQPVEYDTVDRKTKIAGATTAEALFDIEMQITQSSNVQDSPNNDNNDNNGITRSSTLPSRKSRMNRMHSQSATNTGNDLPNSVTNINMVKSAPHVVQEEEVDEVNTEDEGLKMISHSQTSYDGVDTSASGATATGTVALKQDKGNSKDFRNLALEQYQIANELKEEIIDKHYNCPGWCWKVFVVCVTIWTLGCAIITSLWCLYFDVTLNAENENDVDSNCPDTSYDISEQDWLNYNLTASFISNLTSQYYTPYDPPEGDTFGANLETSSRFMISTFTSYALGIFLWQPLTLGAKTLLKYRKLNKLLEKLNNQTSKDKGKKGDGNGEGEDNDSESELDLEDVDEALLFSGAIDLNRLRLLKERADQEKEQQQQQQQEEGVQSKVMNVLSHFRAGSASQDSLVGGGGIITGNEKDSSNKRRDSDEFANEIADDLFAEELAADMVAEETKKTNGNETQDNNKNSNKNENAKEINDNTDDSDKKKDEEREASSTQYSDSWIADMVEIQNKVTKGEQNGDKNIDGEQGDNDEKNGSDGDQKQE